MLKELTKTGQRAWIFPVSSGSISQILISSHKPMYSRWLYQFCKWIVLLWAGGAHCAVLCLIRDRYELQQNNSRLWTALKVFLHHSIYCSVSTALYIVWLLLKAKLSLPSYTMGILTYLKWVLWGLINICEVLWGPWIKLTLYGLVAQSIKVNVNLFIDFSAFWISPYLHISIVKRSLTFTGAKLPYFLKDTCLNDV